MLCEIVGAQENLFRFFEHSGFFCFFTIFDLWLVEFMDAEPTDTEGQLYSLLFSKYIKENQNRNS